MSVSMKNLLGVLLIAMGLFLFWTFLVPEFRDIMAQREAIQERQDLLAERQELMTKINETYTQYQGRAGDIQKFSAVVPAKKSTAELISELEAIAGQSGMQLANISIQQGQSAGDYQVLSINAELLGSYGSLLTFLGAAEQNIRLLDIDSINASAGEGGVTLPRFSLRAIVYFLK